MRTNPTNTIDWYKGDHRRQYPTGTSLVYSNFTPRSTKHAAKLPNVNDKIVVVGLQAALKTLNKIWKVGFFDRPKAEVIAEYKRRCDNALGANAIPMDHMESLHDLGYLPLSFRALPEGTVVNEKIPFFTVHNTLPEFFWLTNYLETYLSNMVWKMATSATVAYKYRQLLTHYAKQTGAPLDFIAFQAHDFSYRGMNGIWDAASSGAGHLTSFVGSDTVPAIDMVEEYYNANSDKELVACSVPATEHSVMTMTGPDGELESFRRLIEDVYPRGIVSVVSDSYDFWQVITQFLPALKEKILARSGGPVGDKVVIRPDSGDPVRIICGDDFRSIGDEAGDEETAKEWAQEMLVEKIAEGTPHGEYGGDDHKEVFEFNGKFYEAHVEIEWNRHDKQYYYIDGSRLKGWKEVTLSPEQKGAIQCLWETFGGTKTASGYKVLDPHIGLIYGDSITLQRCAKILHGLKSKGFASCNVVLGVGSYTYTYTTRDTFGFAMKATAGIVNGKVIEIFKDPKTDSGMKKSAKGFLRVVRDEKGEYVLIDQQPQDQIEFSELKEVYRDGKLLIETSLSEIRERIKNSL